jgi:hypothetical protein
LMTDINEDVRRCIHNALHTKNARFSRLKTGLTDLIPL